MVGVITGREVVHNAGLIWHEFGAGCLLRCMWVIASGKRATFLELACPPWVSAPAHNDEGRESEVLPAKGDEETVKH